MLNINYYKYQYPNGPNSFSLIIKNFQINKGGIVFLHGKSGCGKTTFMNLISGVIKSDLKKQFLQYYDSIDYVMHESKLLPWLTVKKNIKVESKLKKKEVDFNLFSRLCLNWGFDKNFFEIKNYELSLGMRQRIELAMALSFKPHLILMDEALSGIDREVKKKVAYDLWKIVEAEKLSIIGTAHQLTDLLLLAQKVYIFDDGIVHKVINIGDTVEERFTMEPEKLLSLQESYDFWKV